MKNLQRPTLKLKNTMQNRIKWWGFWAIGWRIEKSNLLLGTTNVVGEGVVVTLTDNQERQIQADDLVELINELRFAGAEAISINGVRILSMTDIVDIDSYILIKPRQRLISPYVVKAIGNQTYLTSTLCMKIVDL